MDDLQQVAMIDEILSASGESSCVAFQENFANPAMIGKCSSAIANSAALSSQTCGYVVWGISHGTHAVVGTHFDPDHTKVEEKPLKVWLAQRLTPRVPISFKEVEHPHGRVVALKVPAATISPVEFDHLAYVHLGPTTPRLCEHPEHQHRLRAKLQGDPWESQVAAPFLTGDEVLDRLDYTKYFELTRQRLPDNRTGIFERLSQARLIVEDAGKRWSITNLGAILFAKRLNDFGSRIERKAVRFAAYTGNCRADAVTHRRDWERGYATVFSDLVEYINALVPVNEVIGPALRTDRRPFSKIAVRELVANALIHQDMTISGAGPMIELFPNRVEITNPGTPLINAARFIDAAPRSRNAALATLMQRMFQREALGGGVERVVSEVERFQSPPPEFQIYPKPAATRVVLLAPCRFKDLTSADCVRACYQHAVLRSLRGENMLDASLGKRLGLDARSRRSVSRLIEVAIENGWIKAANQEHPQSGYVPFWG